jgi:hypothetical protein
MRKPLGACSSLYALASGLLVLLGSSPAARAIPGDDGGGNPPAAPAAAYQVDDGSAEDAFGFTRDPGDPPTHDVIYLNRFAVRPGLDVIDSVQIAFGGPGGPAGYNGRPIQVLLYEDPNGGSTTDAVLLRSVAGVTAGANTSAFVSYPLPPTRVHNFLLVGFLARDQPLGDSFLGAQDFTLPSQPNASFVGATVNSPLDPAALGTIAGSGLYGPIESFPNQQSNFLIRADAVPEPSSPALLLAAAPALLARRRRASSTGSPRVGRCPSAPSDRKGM